MARPAAGRAIALGDGLDLGDQMVDFGLAAVEFDNHERLDIERVARVNKGFGRRHSRPIHDFHSAGNDAFADDLGDAAARALDDESR